MRGEEDQPRAVGGAHAVQLAIRAATFGDAPQQFADGDELRLVDGLAAGGPDRFDRFEISLDEDHVRRGRHERRVRVVPRDVWHFDVSDHLGSRFFGSLACGRVVDRLVLVDDVVAEDLALVESHDDLAEDDRITGVAGFQERIVGVRTRLTDHGQSDGAVGVAAPDDDVDVRCLAVLGTVEDGVAVVIDDDNVANGAERGGALPVQLFDHSRRVAGPELPPVLVAEEFGRGLDGNPIVDLAGFPGCGHSCSFRLCTLASLCARFRHTNKPHSL